MSTTHSKAVLITGCSSGIGAATAERLARAGWTVYATARRRETLAGLEAHGCRTLARSSPSAARAGARSSTSPPEGASSPSRARAWDAFLRTQFSQPGKE
jgi:NAD(P)-dependent dehydrogenase (short-subunit alcohol dehydrogenase family)